MFCSSLWNSKLNWHIAFAFLWIGIICLWEKTYKINGEQAIHLNSRPQAKDARPSTKAKNAASCVTCKRYIQDRPNRFCSISCKVIYVISVSFIVFFPYGLFFSYKSIVILLVMRCFSSFYRLVVGKSIENVLMRRYKMFYRTILKFQKKVKSSMRHISDIWWICVFWILHIINYTVHTSFLGFRVNNMQYSRFILAFSLKIISLFVISVESSQQSNIILNVVVNTFQNVKFAQFIWNQIQ